MPQCSKKNTSIARVCYGHMLFGSGFKSCLHERGKQMMDHRRGGPKNLVVNMLLDKHPEPKMQFRRAIFHCTNCATQKGRRLQSSVSWFWQSNRITWIFKMLHSQNATSDPGHLQGHYYSILLPTQTSCTSFFREILPNYHRFVSNLIPKAQRWGVILSMTQNG